MNPRIRFFQVPAPCPLPAFLKEELSLHEEKIRELFELGSIYIDGRRARTQDLGQGQILRVHLEPRRFAMDFSIAGLIAHENEDVLVVRKPAGLPVHATLDNERENLLAFLRAQRSGDLLITHRLDIPTAGLVALAKNPCAQAALNRLFQNRLVEKIYVAEVEGCLEETGLLRHWMEPGQRAPRALRDEDFAGGQSCVLEILSAMPGVSSTRLRLKLHTGRTHQIRAQLAKRGHPILNDVLYGGVRRDERDVIALRACALSWPAREGLAAVSIQDDVERLFFS